jgi:hypothetical protein
MIHLSISICINAQNAKDDLKKIFEVYKTPNMSIYMTYDYYNVLTDKIPTKTIKAELHSNGKSFYQKLDNVETLRTPYLVILADHRNKYLNLDSAWGGTNIMNQSILFDSLFQFYKEISVSTLGIQKIYRLASLAPGISHSILTVDTTNWQIKKLEVFFFDNRENVPENKIRNKLIIKYDRLYRPCQKQESFFNENNFVTTVGNKHYKQPKYSNYTFLNNIQ